MAFKRRIVDAHHHLWDLARGYNYPWLQDRPLGVGVCGDVAPIARDYLIDDYLSDCGDYELAGSVHVEAVAADPLEETRWLWGVAQARGLPQTVVARAALHAPDVEATLAAHKAFSNVRGIRHIVNWHPDPKLTFTDHDFLANEAWLSGFRLLKKYGFSFDLQLYPAQLPEAAALAQRHPDTLIVLNHTGMPLRGVESLRQWREGMRLVASAENAVVKISGLGMVDWYWTQHSIRPLVLETIDLFGVDRCMFASNFPVDRLYGAFAALYGAFEAIVADFSETEKAALFCDNALRLYRIEGKV